jgi:hypothetical protein
MKRTSVKRSCKYSFFFGIMDDEKFYPFILIQHIITFIATKNRNIEKDLLFIRYYFISEPL